MVVNRIIDELKRRGYEVIIVPSSDYPNRHYVSISGSVGILHLNDEPVIYPVVISLLSSFLLDLQEEERKVKRNRKALLRPARPNYPSRHPFPKREASNQKLAKDIAYFIGHMNGELAQLLMEIRNRL